MYAGYPEEGDECPEPGCTGHLGFPKVENCSCHISAPCHACVNSVLTCDECGWEDDSPDEKLVPLVTGKPVLEMFEHKPRPLDSTKIDWRDQMHSGCSMKKVGVYPVGTTMEAVRKEVDGTFGGHFESFGGGKFVFIAYTD